MIYTLRARPRSLYRLRERLESDDAAEWIQYNIAKTNRPDVALQISNFCLERGAGVELVKGIRCRVV